MSIDAPPERRAPAKLRGLSHLFASARYSAGGLARLLGETAFRQEIMLGAAILLILALASVSPAMLLIQVVLLLILAAAEALNTAIELIVDRVSPEVSVFAKQAKDLGSFAVFCLLVVNLGFAAGALLLHA
ncbi:diacylglycerol kinase [Aureimonas sp. AU4]|uniref:diacylglycerol kinase n=1 Tax=Aureimonas sp. AU4 TaxID=1638163 RepID=UPI0007802598|nr:diacylglycerol kinase [Aureimonas sp. AU4]